MKCCLWMWHGHCTRDFSVAVLNKIKPPKPCYQSTLQQTALTGLTGSPGQTGHVWEWECVGDIWRQLGWTKSNPLMIFSALLTSFLCVLAFPLLKQNIWITLQRQKLFWLTVLKVFVCSQLSPLLLGLGQAAQHSSVTWQSKSWHSRDTKQKGEGPILDMIPWPENPL